MCEGVRGVRCGVVLYVLIVQVFLFVKTTAQVPWPAVGIIIDDRIVATEFTSMCVRVSYRGGGGGGGWPRDIPPTPPMEFLEVNVI